MNREEILSKSREENKSGDERVKQVEARAGNIAFRLGASMCFILVLIGNILNETMKLSMPLFSLYMFMAASSELYVGIKLRATWRIVMGAIYAVLCVACLTAFVLDCIGVLPL